MLDAIIHSGKVVSPWSTTDADVAIKDGKIAAIGSLNGAEATRRIDAKGLYVVPGGVDPHVHFGKMFAPFIELQSPFDATRAAAFGGTTTVVDFAWHAHGRDTAIEAIERRREELDPDVAIDYALHLIVSGALSLDEIRKIPEAIEYGIPSIKVFTCFGGDGRPESANFLVDDGRIWGVMDEVARHGGLVAVHAEDEAIVHHAIRRLTAEGRTEGRFISEARPNLAEAAAVKRLIVLAEATGAAVYFLHLSSHEAVEAVSGARARGLPVYAEVLHHYLVWSNEDYGRKNGAIYHNYPPLKSPQDRDAMWAALAAGVISTIGSDEATVPLDVKLHSPTIEEVTGGNNGIEMRVPVAFSEGVSAGKLSVNQFVAVTATNPAMLLGLLPRKGILAPGSDADVVLIDPEVKKTTRLADLHSVCDYSVWDGWEFHGYPVLTMAGGRVIVEDGEFRGQRGDGRFVPRTMSRDVTAGAHALSYERGGIAIA